VPDADGVSGLVPFVDSHVHLAGEAFDADRDEVIARARDSGCRAMVVIGESLEAAERAQRLAAAHPGFVFCTAGIHPHDASTFDPARTPDALRACVRAGAVALGECGLDYHYDHSPREVQRRVFDAHLALAAELDRPVVVHTREAEADTIDALRQAAAAGVRGVLHCFGGSAALADAAMAAGWFVSFSGIVTFKKWDGDALIRDIPTGRWLVESDAPFLAPVPFRGKRNEPAHVARTLAHVAAARGLPLPEAAREALAATQACFALPPTLGAA
jgi:TatD DNase family protein